MTLNKFYFDMITTLQWLFIIVEENVICKGYINKIFNKCEILTFLSFSNKKSVIKQKKLIA